MGVLTWQAERYRVKRLIWLRTERCRFALWNCWFWTLLLLHQRKLKPMDRIQWWKSQIIWSQRYWIRLFWWRKLEKIISKCLSSCLWKGSKETNYPLVWDWRREIIIIDSIRSQKSRHWKLNKTWKERLAFIRVNKVKRVWVRDWKETLRNRKTKNIGSIRSFQNSSFRSWKFKAKDIKDKRIILVFSQLIKWLICILFVQNFINSTFWWAYYRIFGTVLRMFPFETSCWGINIGRKLLNFVRMGIKKIQRNR